MKKVLCLINYQWEGYRILMFDFENENDGQRNAIVATEGSVLITAGSGTGKTYTLVQRTIYLIVECIVKPENIFIATFTEKAGTFYRAGYIEAWGRGIQKICEACEELGAPMPEYILMGDDLTVNFQLLKVLPYLNLRRQNAKMAD